MKLIRISVACAAAFWLSLALSQSNDDPNVAWLIGTWEKTVDEDQAPPDRITFRADGTWISYGPENQQRVSPYHLNRGDIYLTVEMQGKGPVALVFRPSSDRKKLVFTSPRTIGNATYERVGSVVKK